MKYDNEYDNIIPINEIKAQMYSWVKQFDILILHKVLKYIKL
jgi:hypothetical protein